MAAGGVAGLIVVLGLLGAFGSTGEGALTAPHDEAAEAAKGVVPDAHIALHGNVQAAMGAFDQLLAEVSELEVIAGDADTKQTLGMMRTGLDGLLAGVQGSLGVDLRKDVGSITLSVAIPSEDQVRMVLRARGNLGGLNLEELVPSQDGDPKVFQGVELRPLPGGEELRDHVVARPDGSTLLVGDRELIQDLIMKKTWKSTAKQAPSRLTAGLKKGATGFVYLAPPPWAVAKAGKNKSLRGFADLIGGVDYMLYSVGPGGARVRIATHDAAVGRQITHLMTAGASLLSMVEPSVDVLVHGLLGVAPLIPDHEMDAALRKVLANEQAVQALGVWLRKRFGGKATVKATGAPATIDLDMENPASIGSLLLPMGAGVAAWHLYAPIHHAPIMEAPETFD